MGCLLASLIVGLLSYVIVSILMEPGSVALLGALFSMTWVVFSVLIALNQSDLNPGYVIISDVSRTILPVIFLFLFIKVGLLFFLLEFGLSGVILSLTLSRFFL